MDEKIAALEGCKCEVHVAPEFPEKVTCIFVDPVTNLAFALMFEPIVANALAESLRLAAAKAAKAALESAHLGGV